MMISPFFPSFGPIPMSHSSNVNLNCMNMGFESSQLANQSKKSHLLTKNVSNSTNSNNNVPNVNNSISDNINTRNNVTINANNKKLQQQYLKIIKHQVIIVSK